jgi:hypothetical protein
VLIRRVFIPVRARVATHIVYYCTTNSLWTCPLFIPSYFALASILVLVLQAAFSSGSFKRFRARIIFATAVDEGEDEDEGVDSDDNSTQTGLVEAVKDHVERSGGSAIFFFQFLRLVLVLALLGLSIFSFLKDEEQVQQQDSVVVDLMRKKKHKHKHRQGQDSELSEREWLDLAFCLNYVRISQESFYVLPAEAMLVLTNRL